jgi:hypothetical protein
MSVPHDPHALAINSRELHDAGSRIVSAVATEGHGVK